MRTGVLLPSLVVASSRDLVAWARTAEDAGFDTLGVRGRIVLDSLEPLVALSVITAATRRIEIVVHLPAVDLTQPRILGRQLAGLDRASRHRLAVAVGDAGAWTFTARDGARRRLAVLRVPAVLDAVRAMLDDHDRAGADDVLLDVPSTDRRDLERLAELRLSFVPALAMETSEDVGTEGPLRRILAQDLTAG